jgi:hypothetical protein
VPLTESNATLSKLTLDGSSDCSFDCARWLSGFAACVVWTVPDGRAASPLAYKSVRERDVSPVATTSICKGGSGGEAGIRIADNYRRRSSCLQAPMRALMCFIALTAAMRATDSRKQEAPIHHWCEKLHDVKQHRQSCVAGPHGERRAAVENDAQRIRPPEVGRANCREWTGASSHATKRGATHSMSGLAAVSGNSMSCHAAVNDYSMTAGATVTL